MEDAIADNEGLISTSDPTTGLGIKHD